VAALERWTHEQLASIHGQHSSEVTPTSKEKQSAEQIKVLDTSAELLAKMVEVHCMDKAQLLRKLWSGSGDLFQTIYTELATVIHDLKLTVAEKTRMCEKLEDSIDRLRESILPRNSAGASTPAVAEGRSAPGHDNEASRLSAHDAEQYRALQQELLLKNQEMLELQSTLTSLSIWFPNFARFNSSVLSKYLPPVDYLEQLEREKREEEERVREAQAKKDEEERRQQQLQQGGRSGKLTTQGSNTLTSIGEDGKAPDPAAEEDQVQLAQDFLLRDLKRLQGLGIGFAVLDPTEYDACKAVLAGNMELAQSAGVFAPAGGSGGGAHLSGKGTVKTVLSSTGQPVAVPAVLTAALSRTSVAVRNKFKGRSGKIQSFVEVRGDEYALGAPRSPGSASGAGDGEDSCGADDTRPVEGVAGNAGNAIAAAAAAVRKMFETDTHSPVSPVTASTVGPVPPSPNVADLNVGDYYKLQNARVTKVDPNDAAGAIARIAANISQKRKPNYYTAQDTAQQGSSAASGRESPFDDADDMDDAEGVTEAEYEAKYRALLIDAQKLELAKAGAEKKMKEEQKAHHKQLLRMSAQITTLQNKLQTSTLSTSALLAKLPHVVFAPLIPRHRVRPVEYGDAVRYSGTGSYPTSRGKSAPLASRGADFCADDAESAIFGDSVADPVSVLLNNAPGHRVKFDPRSELNDNTMDSFTAELSKLSVNYVAQTAHSSERVTDVAPQLPPATQNRYFSLTEIERIVSRFCAQFVQPAPFVPHGDSNSVEAGMGARDELFASFGQGAYQWTHANLSNCLSGQQASFFETLSLDSSMVGADSALGPVLAQVEALLEESVFAGHVFQFLCAYGGAHSASSSGRTSHTATSPRSVCVNAVLTLHKMCCSLNKLLHASSGTSAQSSQLQALSELFCLSRSRDVHAVQGEDNQHSHLCALTDPLQRHLRGRIYIDLYLHCFRGMQVSTALSLVYMLFCTSHRRYIRPPALHRDISPHTKGHVHSRCLPRRVSCEGSLPSWGRKAGTKLGRSRVPPKRRWRHRARRGGDVSLPGTAVFIVCPGLP
jgi:hypothetical protein